MISPTDVLRFWFEETPAAKRFGKDPNFDSKIRERFSETYDRIVAGDTSEWRATPEGRLAEIIVLDQLSRNMFRDTPQSFSADSIALRLAREALSFGADKKVPADRRAFFYMPFMHSEEPAAHVEAMKLFDQPGLEEAFKFEKLHKVIIDRFGRYPHRNAILGRKSTPEEIEFLKEKNSSF